MLFHLIALSSSRLHLLLACSHLKLGRGRNGWRFVVIPVDIVEQFGQDPAQHREAAQTDQSVPSTEATTAATAATAIATPVASRIAAATSGRATGDVVTDHRTSVGLNNRSARSASVTRMRQLLSYNRMITSGSHRNVELLSGTCSTFLHNRLRDNGFSRLSSLSLLSDSFEADGRVTSWTSSDKFVNAWLYTGEAELAESINCGFSDTLIVANQVSLRLRRNASRNEVKQLADEVSIAGSNSVVAFDARRLLCGCAGQSLSRGRSRFEDFANLLEVWIDDSDFHRVGTIAADYLHAASSKAVFAGRHEGVNAFFNPGELELTERVAVDDVSNLTVAYEANPQRRKSADRLVAIDNADTSRDVALFINAQRVVAERTGQTRYDSLGNRGSRRFDWRVVEQVLVS